MNIPARIARLTDYELAAEFHSVATQRCTSHDEDYARMIELELIGAEMDRRDVQLEDWSLTSHQDRSAEL